MGAVRLGLEEREDRDLYSAGGVWRGIYPKANGWMGVRGVFGPSDRGVRNGLVLMGRKQ
jgi:hypothetical protein